MHKNNRNCSTQSGKCECLPCSIEGCGGCKNNRICVQDGSNSRCKKLTANPTPKPIDKIQPTEPETEAAKITTEAPVKEPTPTPTNKATILLTLQPTDAKNLTQNPTPAPTSSITSPIKLALWQACEINSECESG